MTQAGCVLAHVSGRVQGVYFRACTAEQATSLGLSGYAKNLQDGRVEVLVAGPSQKIAVLLKWLQSGSPGARVDQVEVEHIDCPAALSSAFTIG